MRARIITTTSLFLIGAGVGWLVGLSVSPVVSIVLTSVMGTVAALVAALSGLDVEGQSPRFQVNPVPIAVLIVGIIAGSLLGLRARNANWLGYTLQQEVARWQTAGLELHESAILLRLFEREYPTAAGEPVTKTVPTPLGAGTYLFAVEAQECAQLLLASDEDLAPLFLTLADERLHRLPEIIVDDAVLACYVKEVLCADAN